jgi:integrase
VLKNGDTLINAAGEIHRSRILSFAEEMRLLNATDSEPRRFHLKGMVLIALDCAFRKNEILTLCPKDIDLMNKTITIRAFNTKTAKTRTVGMTSRVYE